MRGKEIVVGSRVEEIVRGATFMGEIVHELTDPSNHVNGDMDMYTLKWSSSNCIQGTYRPIIVENNVVKNILESNLRTYGDRGVARDFLEKEETLEGVF